MSKQRPGILSLVLVPAVVTLIVTVVRLVGEMNGWSPLWFGATDAKAGGDNALLGISWLIFVFGFWFGIRLQKSSPRKAPGKTLLMALVAILAVAGGIATCVALDLVWFPSEETPGEPRGLPYMLGCMGLGVVLAFVAWGRAALALLVYAFLARIPVVIVTWLAVDNDWGTHYTKMPSEFVLPEGMQPITFLVMPQVTVWPMATVMLGTVCAALGAMLIGKPKQ